MVWTMKATHQWKNSHRRSIWIYLDYTTPTMSWSGSKWDILKEWSQTGSLRMNPNQIPSSKYPSNKPTTRFCCGGFCCFYFQNKDYFKISINIYILRIVDMPIQYLISNNRMCTILFLQIHLLYCLFHYFRIRDLTALYPLILPPQLNSSRLQDV